MPTDKNPWNVADWNMTEQAAYIRAFGVTRAEARARDAGTTLGAPRIQPIPKRRYLEGSYIFHTEIVEEE